MICYLCLSFKFCRKKHSNIHMLLQVKSVSPSFYMFTVDRAASLDLNIEEDQTA